MKKKNIFVIFGIIGIIVGITIAYFFMYGQAKDKETLVELEDYPSLFRILITQENYQKYLNGEEPASARVLPKEENLELYNQVRDSVIIQNTVVVFPLFTAAAYDKPGFYDYFRGECDDSCLTVELKNRDDVRHRYNTSGLGMQVLNILGYKFITDLEIHKNPQVLKEFDRVILLHSEYVTREEFDAITQHPNVLYLYPNALYAEVEYDEKSNTIKLIRGHNYPEPEIRNGFDWEFDNTSQHEYDMDCNDWEFYKIDNGYMLDCYPEIRILNDFEMLKTIKYIDFLEEK